MCRDSIARTLASLRTEYSRLVAATRAFLVLVAAAALASCGGTGNGVEMRATLTETECSYDGSTTPPVGMFTVDVVNETASFGAFALARLADGSTIDDLEPFLERARAQFAEDGTLPDLPATYEQLVRTGVEAGASGLLPADVTAGTYALVCFVDDLPTWKVYAATQLDVTG
jgi:hypothetical protein